MEFYIVQLDFSAAFNRVSHSCLLFKFKSIGVGGSVLSICKEFLSNHRQRVVVDGSTSEWIRIVYGMPQESVLGHLLFIPYASECFSWWRTDYMPMLMTPHNWQLFASQQTYIPAVAASLNRALARIQEWCSRSCMVLNPNKLRL